MKKIKLDICYVGTAYCGWQVQPNAPSIQAMIQNAAEKLFGAPCAVTGCSRTDSGVHARSFICALTLTDGANNIPAHKIPIAMNIHLPDDIAVKTAEEVHAEFHPRYDATGKEYIYLISDSPLRDPFMHGRCARSACRLDHERMAEAAKAFVGTHDFAAFMAAGSKITDSVRQIYDCRAERSADMITITVSGNGFLYNMVRIIAGTLCEVGRGKLDYNDITAIIDSKDRSLAGNTMPAEGLYLNRVFYQRKESEADAQSPRS